MTPWTSGHPTEPIFCNTQKFKPVFSKQDNNISIVKRHMRQVGTCSCNIRPVWCAAQNFCKFHLTFCIITYEFKTQPNPNLERQKCSCCFSCVLITTIKSPLFKTPSVTSLPSPLFLSHKNQNYPKASLIAFDIFHYVRHIYNPTRSQLCNTKILAFQKTDHCN